MIGFLSSRLLERWVRKSNYELSISNKSLEHFQRDYLNDGQENTTIDKRSKKLPIVPQLQTLGHLNADNTNVR
jgi:hypothetical protein